MVLVGAAVSIGGGWSKRMARFDDRSRRGYALGLACWSIRQNAA
jgi:hypothetical protein